MKVIDNVNDRLVDDLTDSIKPGARINVVAESFSIYSFEALKKQLEQINELRFIYTKPTFVEEDLKIKMIDYERCLFGDFPKNATQFLQYLKKNTSLLRKKGIELDYEKIHEMGKRYSKNREVFDLKEIIKV